MSKSAAIIIQQLFKYCSKITSMKNIIVLLALLVSLSSCALIDLTQSNLYMNSSILQTVCNTDMELTFSFSPQTKLTCSNSACSIQNGHLSTLFFLDVNRAYLRLKLSKAEITTEDLVIGYEVTSFYFIFYFTDEYNNEVDVLVPFRNGGEEGMRNVLTISELNEPTFNISLIGFMKQIVDPSQGITLQGFNLMNYRDYCRFGEVANHQRNHTVLVNEWIFNLPNVFPITSMTSFAAINFVPDYPGTGNKVCYSSYASGTGMFHTHIRQNWVTWTCFFELVFFWAYYCIAPQTNNEVFNERFKQNNLTCWGFYSLHHLAHIEFFSRLSRLSLLFFVHSFEAMVLAALYTTIGTRIPLYSDYSITIWFPAIAMAAGLPFTAALGGTFLQKIYDKTHTRLALKKEHKKLPYYTKETLKEYMQKLYKMDYHLSILYFWYYMIIFFGVLCFWASSIHMTLWMSMEYYYLQRLWLVSLGISFVVKNLVFEPILAKLLGRFQFYRKRGFYYRYEIGKLFRQIEHEL